MSTDQRLVFAREKRFTRLGQKWLCSLYFTHCAYVIGYWLLGNNEKGEFCFECIVLFSVCDLHLLDTVELIVKLFIFNEICVFCLLISIKLDSFELNFQIHATTL